jgi:hypothetical protein
MSELFGTCRFPNISSRHVIAISRYYYLWNLIDEALRVLNPIFEAYFSLGIADDNFLHIRGLPFFGETWSYQLCYAIIRNDFLGIDDLTHHAKAKLSDYDFDRLSLFLDCCKKQAFEPEIRALEESLRNPHPLIPNGYQKVQLASLKSLGRTDDSLLAEISLSERDFPWLVDVLLIHRAQIAHSNNQEQKERELIKLFMDKQPRLFEPNHAANFAFVKYQETLKPLYQGVRLNT